ncbi:MAG: hypothetical protein RIB53_01040 [Roseitalea porphyridii]|jgi:hypothetical protein|uniref:hypothetical protein n=1 Tax=Roseitalea porphyridii TaxID=1852022 RepID=UPI0032EDBDEE
MNVHENAPIAPPGRAVVIGPIEDEGRPVAGAAAAPCAPRFGRLEELVAEMVANGGTLLKFDGIRDVRTNLVLKNHKGPARLPLGHLQAETAP